MCKKHAWYEVICIEREAHNLRREIKEAEDSIIDVDFKIDRTVPGWRVNDIGHTCDSSDGPDDPCTGCRLEVEEAERLAKEESDDSVFINEASYAALVETFKPVIDDPVVHTCDTGADYRRDCSACHLEHREGLRQQAEIANDAYWDAINEADAQETEYISFVERETNNE